MMNSRVYREQSAAGTGSDEEEHVKSGANLPCGPGPTPDEGSDHMVDAMHEVLAEIALGRQDCGRPHGGETARQMARDVLLRFNLRWPCRAPR